MNYEHYGKIIETAKNKIVGNIPDEMIVKAHPEKKGDMIKQAQRAFSLISEELSEISSLRLKELRNYDLSKADDETLINLFSGKGGLSGFIMRRLTALKSAKLEKSFADILPSGNAVKIEYAGEGAFGIGYKLSFIDRKGNKIMHDRVMKIFKDQKEMTAYNKACGEKALELISIDDKRLYSLFQKALPKEKCPWKNFDEFQIYIKKEREQMIQIDKFSAGSANGSSVYDMSRHGLGAEANSAQFIRKALGHNMSHTDLIKPDMYDLQHGFSLAPFSDESLGAVTSKTNFSYMGIIPGDLHNGNVIAGRIIDYGDMTLRDKALSDKVVLRYFKKIMNRDNAEERLELIKRIERLVQNPGTPHRKKIQQALNFAYVYTKPSIRSGIQLKQDKNIKFNFLDTEPKNRFIIKRNFRLDPKRDEQKILNYADNAENNKFLQPQAFNLNDIKAKAFYDANDIFKNLKLNFKVDKFEFV